MNNANFNITVNEHNKNIEAYNKKAKESFEKYGGIDLLTKYVMSETLAPIEDYENVANIIRSNYHRCISGKLLIIGAYSVINWSSSENELLGILNLMYEYLPDEERAIIHYLNASQAYVRNDLKENEECMIELRKTLNFSMPFVYNRCRIAECSTKEEAKKYYREALDNVQEIFLEENIMKLPLEHFLEPQSFINEFILGTHMIKARYDEIKEKLNQL